MTIDDLLRPPTAAEVVADLIRMALCGTTRRVRPRYRVVADMRPVREHHKR